MKTRKKRCAKCHKHSNTKKRLLKDPEIKAEYDKEVLKLSKEHPVQTRTMINAGIRTN